MSAEIPKKRGRPMDRAGLERLRRELQHYPLTQAAARANVSRRTARRWIDAGYAEDVHTYRRGGGPTKPHLAVRQLPEGVHAHEGGLRREQLLQAVHEMLVDPGVATGPRVAAARLAWELLEADGAARDAGHDHHADVDEDPLTQLDRLSERHEKSKIAELIEAGGPVKDGWRST